MMQNVMSDQDQHCLQLIQQFFRHIVKRTSSNVRTNKSSGVNGSKSR